MSIQHVSRVYFNSLSPGSAGKKINANKKWEIHMQIIIMSVLAIKMDTAILQSLHLACSEPRISQNSWQRVHLTSQKTHANTFHATKCI